MINKKFTIGIVGCGTAGLAVAIALHRDGHHVELFERFAETKPLGAGLMLQPTGLACLAEIGLDQRVIANSTQIHRLDGRTRQGRTVFDLSYHQLAPHFFGLGTHRSVLFNVLYEAVQQRNIPIHCGVDVLDSQLQQDKRVLLDAHQNRSGPFDLVIDASGQSSKLRERLGVITLNRPYPYGAVWGLLDDPGQTFGQHCLQQRFESTQIMIGALPVGRRLNSDVDQLAFFWSLPVQQYSDWLKQPFENWQQQVMAIWPELTEWIGQFQTHNDLTLAQYRDVVMQSCYGERLLFLGDAAHCTSPQLGQGANLALMDAIQFARTLRKTHSIEMSLPRFAAERRGHVRFYQTTSRWLTPFFQSDGSLAGRLRDASFGLMCKTPYLKTEMMRTLSGIKTGLFSHMDPGDIHPRYRLRGE